MNNMHLKSNLIENHKLVSIVKDLKLATSAFSHVPIHIKQYRAKSYENKNWNQWFTVEMHWSNTSGSPHL